MVAAPVDELVVDEPAVGELVEDELPTDSAVDEVVVGIIDEELVPDRPEPLDTNTAKALKLLLE